MKIPTVLERLHTTPEEIRATAERLGMFEPKGGPRATVPRGRRIIALTTDQLSAVPENGGLPEIGAVKIGKGSQA